MRGVVLLGVVCGLIGACSNAPAGPIIIGQPGRVVIVQAPVPVSEGGVESTDDAGAEASTSVDASVLDAGSMVCSGPDPVGQASDNCEARGPCSLNTCVGSEAFTCTGPSGAGAASGYPKDLTGCVESAADEFALSTGLGRVHCCERACVRHSQNDVACRGIVFSCPKGILPVAPPGTTVCAKGTEGVGDYCCR